VPITNHITQHTTLWKAAVALLLLSAHSLVGIVVTGDAIAIRASG